MRMGVCMGMGMGVCMGMGMCYSAAWKRSASRWRSWPRAAWQAWTVLRCASMAACRRAGVRSYIPGTTRSWGEGGVALGGWSGGGGGGGGAGRLARESAGVVRESPGVE